MKKYHVAVSFASEQRNYVNNIVEYLKQKNISVFYDEHNLAKSWGENLYNYLEKIYLEEAHLIVLFVSKEYVKKKIPRHEAKSAMNNPHNFILIVKFDNSILEDENDSNIYLSTKKIDEEKLASYIEQKLIDRGLVFGEYSLSQDSTVSYNHSLEENIEVCVLDHNNCLFTYENVYLIQGSLYKNSHALTEASKVHTIKTPRRNFVYSIYMADKCHPGIYLKNISAGTKIEVKLKKKDNTTGSLIGSGWVNIPDFCNINPKLDGNNRYYFYGINIECNKRPSSPYRFTLGEDLALEKFSGEIKNIRILHGINNAFLIEYKK